MGGRQVQFKITSLFLMRQNGSASLRETQKHERNVCVEDAESHCCRDCVTANSFGQVQKEMEFDKGSGTKCAGSEFWRFG